MVIMEGFIEEVKVGEKEIGRMIVKEFLVGEVGVRIFCGMDEVQFWCVVEECMEKVDEVNKKFGRQIVEWEKIERGIILDFVQIIYRWQR